MPLGISSRLSRIKCPSGSRPKAPGQGWAGDTSDYPKKKKNKKKSQAYKQPLGFLHSYLKTTMSTNSELPSTKEFLLI